MSDDPVRICVVQGGKRNCYDIESELYKGMGLFTKLIIGLAASFFGVLFVLGILSFQAGALGYDVVSALILAAIILLIPISCVFALWLGIFIYKNVRQDGKGNLVIVILLIIVLGIGLYILWSWAFGQIVSLWGTIVASW